MIEDYDYIQALADKDVAVLKVKGQTYGSSWRNRGGVGAFMMLARKWDRIENQCKANGYDVFQAIGRDGAIDGILDDIEDLRRYLLLVQSHMEAPRCSGSGSGNGVKGCPVLGCMEKSPHTHPDNTLSGVLKI